jgi:hypothetical protein
MQLKFLFYIFTTSLLLWLIATASKPYPDSYRISGQVEAIKGKVADAKLKYSQNPKDFDVKNMKEVDIRADGSFQSAINVKPHAKVYFYVHKEGYTKAREVRILKKGKNDLGTIKICKLIERSGYRGIRAHKPSPKLKLYKDECLTRYDDMVGLEEIEFFEELDILRRDRNDCDKRENALLLSAKLSLRGKPGPDAYFALEFFNTPPSYRAGTAESAEIAPILRGTLLSKWK